MKHGSLRWAALLALPLVVAACSRDRGPDATEGIRGDEAAAFRAPADSSVTTAQVENYLRTALRQLERIRGEAPAVRASLDTARAPTATVPGQRPTSRQARWNDFVDAAFVRAAREEGQNPAEMWYVRTRLDELGGYLLAREAHAGGDEAAARFREQAEALRGAPGATEEQVQVLLRAAEQAEQQPAPPLPASIARNLQAVRSGRAAVSDSAWMEVARIAGGTGMTDLADVPAAEVESRLEGFRALHLHALHNGAPPPP